MSPIRQEKKSGTKPVTQPVCFMSSDAWKKKHYFFFKLHDKMSIYLSLTRLTYN